MGGWKLWDDVEKYLVGTPIYFDTAFTLNFITDEQLLRIIKNHGSEKILHATDSPWESKVEWQNIYLPYLFQRKIVTIFLQKCEKTSENRLS